jgi:hypothetical protein
MNKLATWLGAGTISLTVAACGGKVVVDGLGDNTGGASSQSTSATTASGTPQHCGDIVLPSPAELIDCTPGTSGVGSGGPTTCETDMCDANGNIFEAVCTGGTCSCQLNGFVKCGCSTEGVNDFCASGPACCPWIPIPL